MLQRKVIEGLDCCAETANWRRCADCPYDEHDDQNCQINLMKDALKALKMNYFTPADISDLLIEYGQHDSHFKLGETIKYSPSEVYTILNNVHKPLTGKWERRFDAPEYHPIAEGSPVGCPWWWCTCCDKPTTAWVADTYKYCPNCGAKMEGVKYENN